MRQAFQVDISNSVNRYGSRFAVEAITDMVWSSCHFGVPTCLGHDRSRLIGWNRPLAVHFEPGLVRSLNIQELAEDTDDWTIIENRANWLYQNNISKSIPLFNKLHNLLKASFLGEERVIDVPIVVAFFEKDLAARAFPKIFQRAEQDKDGLFPANELKPIGAGVYQLGELVIFAHPYFRRALFRLNTLNGPFLHNLQNLPSELLPRVALDRDVVGLASTFHDAIELIYWWGPKFDDDLSKIPPGVTRFEADEDDKLFFGYSGMELWWQSRKGEHIFEAEELTDREMPLLESDIDILSYGCRYVHSIVSENDNQILHLDGAIRVYSESTMRERRENPINKAGRHTEYTKLWRIDGGIDIPTWKSLLSDYFRDNILMGEYFGISYDYPVSPIRDVNPDSIVEYVPYSMYSGMGVRVALSYQYDPAVTSSSEHTHELMSYDYLSLENQTYTTIENKGLELQKILTSLGVAIKVPQNSAVINHYDDYVNLPIVFHNPVGVTLEDALSKTHHALEILFTAWQQAGYDKVVTYSLGFYLDDRRVQVSVIGHVDDLCDWIQCPLSHIPASKTGLDDWAERAAEFLDANYPVALDNPPLFKTLMHSGILSIQRKTAPEEIKYTLHVDERGLGIKNLEIPEGNEQLRHLLKEGKLFLSASMLVSKTKCTRCGTEYIECNCSKILDEDVHQIILDGRILPLFWTDRPYSR